MIILGIKDVQNVSASSPFNVSQTDTWMADHERSSDNVRGERWARAVVWEE